MAFGMFSGQASPIAIDLGSSSAKLLQVNMQGEAPALVAAAEVPVPDDIRGDADRTMAFWAEALPKALKSGRFKGKRAVISVHSSQTLTQHTHIRHTHTRHTDTRHTSYRYRGSLCTGNWCAGHFSDSPRI